MEDDIGTGTVQGFTSDEKLPIIRLFLSDLTTKGERYLKSKKCLTVSGKHSRLYVIEHNQLTVRRNGAKRQNTQTTQ